MSDVPIEHIMALDDIEASVERVFCAVRGLREDTVALVLAIAQYGALWIAADAHVAEMPSVSGPMQDVVRAKVRADIIEALLEHSMPAGRRYAEAMIAEGTIRGRTRPRMVPGSWPAR